MYEKEIIFNLKARHYLAPIIAEIMYDRLGYIERVSKRYLSQFPVYVTKEQRGFNQKRNLCKGFVRLMGIEYEQML